MAESEEQCVTDDVVKEAEDVAQQSKFYIWLKSASLEKYYERFSTNGITEVCHLEDVKADDAASLGLSKFEQRRLARLYADYKAEKQCKQSSQGQSVEVPNKASFRTSSSSVVLTLPKVMKNFVQTRDGQGNVVVRTESL